MRLHLRGAVVAEHGQSDSAAKGSEGSRLGTRLRGKLAGAYAKRGHQRSNLSYVYSPKCDQDLVLVGDLAYGHFLLCEGSPEIETVGYAHQLSDAERDRDSGFDATVTFVTGEIQRRKLVRSAKQQGLALTADMRPADKSSREQPQGVVVTLTELDIYANQVLIRNWNRVVPWLAQVRDRPLHSYLLEVAALVRGEGSVSLSDVMAMGKEASGEAALYVAAAFKGVQKGLFQSNLDSRPLSLATWLRAQEE